MFDDPNDPPYTRIAAACLTSSMLLSALIIVAFIVLIAGFAQSAHAGVKISALHSMMHGHSLPVCNDEADEPDCYIDATDSDGSIPGVDEIQPALIDEGWTACRLRDGTTIRFDHHHCVVAAPGFDIPADPVVGDHRGIRFESRNTIMIIDETIRSGILAWLAAGQRPAEVTPYRDFWWQKNYSSMPGRDGDDRGDADDAPSRGEPARNISQDRSEQPRGRENFDHRTNPPTPIDPVSGKPRG